MKSSLAAVFLTVLILAGCTNDQSSDFDINPTLTNYIALQQDLLINDSSIIACSAGSAAAIDIFFYPTVGAKDFRYFEAKGTNIDEGDFSLYVERKFELKDVFNGYLRRFEHTNPEQDEFWCIVTYKNDTSLNICQPIRIKQHTKPTLKSNNVTIDQTASLSPKFTWSDEGITDNAIYFQVVSSAAGDLLSGTYTYDTTWTFYNLTNVVLNVRDVNPPPTLTLGNQYGFTMMGVSQDNWVNQVIEQSFTAQ